VHDWLNNSRQNLYYAYPCTTFPLSHYANEFSHSPYGPSCNEAKPQPKIQPNRLFAVKFPSHYVNDGNGSLVNSNETFCFGSRAQHLWRLATYLRRVNNNYKLKPTLKCTPAHKNFNYFIFPSCYYLK